jgi:ATP-dependent protease HslVU (ClpYQ) peptidase subunit
MFASLWQENSNSSCPWVLTFTAAARALIDQPDLDAEEIGRRAMQIAADICVYTNHNFVCEVLEEKKE